MYNINQKITDLYLMNCSELHKNTTYLNAYSLLDDIRKEKTNQYNTLEDKCVSIGVGLLCNLLRSRYHIPSVLYNKCGKPFLINSRFYISISHSVDYAFVGLSTSPLGIDIEYQDRDYLYIADHFFTNDEREEIGKSNDNVKTFFDIWCRKECIIKKNGFQELQRFSVLVTQPNNDFYSFSIPNYSCVCYSDNTIPVTFQEINICDILSRNMQNF